MMEKKSKIENQNSVIVVKLGGTEGVDFSAICTDAAELLSQGQKLVFVHGGSAEANSLAVFYRLNGFFSCCNHQTTIHPAQAKCIDAQPMQLLGQQRVDFAIDCHQEHFQCFAVGVAGCIS